MKIPPYFACVALTLPVGALAVLPQNFIANGSFETPDFGPGGIAEYSSGQVFGSEWYVAAGNSLQIVGNDLTPYYHPTAAGHQFAVLNPGGGVGYAIAEDLAENLTAGVTYRLSFVQSAFTPEQGGTPGSLQVTIAPTGGGPGDSKEVGFVVPGDSDWTPQDMEFTPTITGSYTISVGPLLASHISLIDDVSLVAVPEPVTWSFFTGLALASLAVGRRIAY